MFKLFKFIGEKRR